MPNSFPFVKNFSEEISENSDKYASVFAFDIYNNMSTLVRSV